MSFVFRHRLRADGLVVELPDRLRAIIVPLCDGSGALVLTESWATASDEAQFDEVLSGMRRIAGGPALCPAD